MSLRAKDSKDVRGAYKERQKALCKKDYRKGKNSSDAKPWKTSKGYGTASGRECYPGRNYGSRWETRPRWPDEETETEAEGETECELDERRGGASGYEEPEEESYEVQLAKALSLSLAAAEMEESENGAIDLGSIDDTDAFSLVETDLEIGESDMDTDGSDDESEWIDVDEFGRNTDRPTYAQMMKVEVT